MFIYKQVTIDYRKEIRASLCAIYGVGKAKALLICSILGLSYPYYVSNLNLYSWFLLSYVLNFYTWLEARVRRISYQNIKKLYDIKVYRGLRHKDSLPVRGQRSRTMHVLKNVIK